MKEQNAYRILVSEYLLQQTRSDQALPYYHKIIEAYPSIHAMADADIDDLLQLWQGLGYYRRAHHLHKASRAIVQLYGGRIPVHVDELIALPGIGPYTAAAVASFAHGVRAAVVDGNVYRVLSRYRADPKPKDISTSHQHYARVAQDFMKKSSPAAFNQAIMNLGATICTPRAPKCTQCPVSDGCVARASNCVADFPIKTKTKSYKDRYLHFIHYELPSGAFYLHKRSERDIWQGLHGLPVIEGTDNKSLSARALAKEAANLSWPVVRKVTHRSPVIKQTLTHRRLHSRFYTVITDEPPGAHLDWLVVEKEDIGGYALPKTILDYLHTFVL